MMPRYFFDVRDDDGTFVDLVGIELADMDAAISSSRAGQICCEMHCEIRQGRVSIAIRDGSDGPVVLAVTLTTLSPVGTDTEVASPRQEDGPEV